LAGGSGCRGGQFEDRIFAQRSDDFLRVNRSMRLMAVRGRVVQGLAGIVTDIAGVV
jgi:hypothetical protein